MPIHSCLFSCNAVICFWSKHQIWHQIFYIFVVKFGLNWPSLKLKRHTEAKKQKKWISKFYFCHSFLCWIRELCTVITLNNYQFLNAICEQCENLVKIPMCMGVLFCSDFAYWLKWVLPPWGVKGIYCSLWELLVGSCPR